MRTSSDIDDAGRSGAGDWSQPSSMDLALHAGQMPADAGSAVDEEQKGAIYRTIRQPTLHCTGRQLETWEEIETTPGSLCAALCGREVRQETFEHSLKRGTYGELRCGRIRHANFACWVMVRSSRTAPCWDDPPRRDG